MPAGYVFADHGAASGNLLLSLAVPSHVRVGQEIIAVVKMQSTSVRSMVLDADDKPWGREYGLEVRNATDGSAISMRNDYIDMITTIGSERISASCAAYQAVSISGRFHLAAGQYRIRALRIPRQTYGDAQPHSTRYLTPVISNEVTLTVLP
jgi:hypothetical protein